MTPRRHDCREAAPCFLRRADANRRALRCEIAVVRSGKKQTGGVERVGRGIGVGFCGTGSGVTGRVGGLGVRLSGVRWGGEGVQKLPVGDLVCDI